MDIFELANNCAPALQAAYQAAINTPDAAQNANAIDFEAHVASMGRIAINMGLEALHALVNGGKYMNVYERAAFLASSKRTTEDAELKTILSSFYDKRLAFDEHFDRGKELYYGALNIGGTGASKRYSGRVFCISLSSSISSPGAEVSYLKSDSLEDFVSSSGAVLEYEIKDACIANHVGRGQLATVKHLGQLVSMGVSGWPEMLHSDTGYVEAIFSSEVRLDGVEKVRIKNSDYEYFHKAALAKDADAIAISNLDLFTTIESELDKNNLLEKV